MPPSTGVAALFVDQNYQGASAPLPAPGSYNIARLSAPDSVGNDTVSSLQVAPGYTVTVYTDATFQGDSTTFTADTPYVGDAFNDKISSVVVKSASQPAPASGPGDWQQVVFVQPPSYH